MHIPKSPCLMFWHFPHVPKKRLQIFHST
jgi:hypothetical protein